jgi:hypothetical protein
MNMGRKKRNVLLEKGGERRRSRNKVNGLHPRRPCGVHRKSITLFHHQDTVWSKGPKRKGYKEVFEKGGVQFLREIRGGYMVVYQDETFWRKPLKKRTQPQAGTRMGRNKHLEVFCRIPVNPKEMSVGQSGNRSRRSVGRKERLQRKKQKGEKTQSKKPLLPLVSCKDKEDEQRKKRAELVKHQKEQEGPTHSERRPDEIQGIERRKKFWEKLKSSDLKQAVEEKGKEGNEKKSSKIHPL